MEKTQPRFKEMNITTWRFDQTCNRSMREGCPMSDITRRTEVRAEIINVLAHPARLFMIEELAKGEARIHSGSRIVTK